MVVPHGYEWPASAGVLQVRIKEIGAVNRAIAFDIGGDVEVVHALRIGKANELGDRPPVHAPRAVFRVPDQLVDEITEMQDETDLVCGVGPLILEDHSTIGMLAAIVDVLARHERELHGAIIIIARCCDGAADTAAGPVCLREAVEIDTVRL